MTLVYSTESCPQQLWTLVNTPSPSKQYMVYKLAGVVTKQECWSDVHIGAGMGWSSINILAAWSCLVKHRTAGCWIPHRRWCIPCRVWPWLPAEASFSEPQNDVPPVPTSRASADLRIDVCASAHHRNPEWSWYYRLIVRDRSRHRMPRCSVRIDDISCVIVFCGWWYDESFVQFRFHFICMYRGRL